jgi:citrate lyase subunit beta/citryl-CoA lyase
MKLRSLFLVAADSQANIAKAAMLASDALVLDLQHVATGRARAAARSRVVDWIKGRRRAGLMVGVGAQASPCYMDDLLAVVPARPAALVLPKCSGRDALHALDHHLEAIEAAHGVARGSTKIVAVIDTYAAIQGVRYADAPARLVGLCLGADALGAQIGIAPRGQDGMYRAPLAQARTSLVIAAADAGVAAIDAPFPDPHDHKGLVRETRAAVEEGYAGKMCIYPSQVAPVTAAFTSSPERAEWARRVKRIFDAAPGSDAVTLDGTIVGRAQLSAAERILSAFE